MPVEDNKPAAPYLPFKTFLSSLEPFSQVIPPKIDRTIWRQSGLTQGLIMSAYRFFDLIDAHDKPTQALHRLVDNKDKRPSEIKSLLDQHYASLIAHDLSKMTPKMLDDAIEQYGVSGATKKKAITFFLQAAKFAEMPLSSFINIRNTSGTRRRKLTNKRDSQIDGFDDSASFEEEPSSNLNTKKITLSSGGELSLTYSVDLFALSTEDRNFVFKLIDELRNYEASQNSAQKIMTGGAAK